ncbi:MAG: hypothetical protein ACXWQE_00235 [Bdellovibrionales bacterium]
MINIIQGEDKSIAVVLAKTTGFVDLTLATEITVKFPTRAGDPLIKLLSLGDVVVTSAVGGAFSVTLSDTETAAMIAAASQSFEIIVDIGSNRKIYQSRESLTVKSDIF